MVQNKVIFIAVWVFCFPHFCFPLSESCLAEIWGYFTAGSCSFSLGYKTFVVCVCVFVWFQRFVTAFSTSLWIICQFCVELRSSNRSLGRKWFREEVLGLMSSWQTSDRHRMLPWILTQILQPIFNLRINELNKKILAVASQQLISYNNKHKY